MTTIKDYKLLAHYPNNTRLIETGTKDNDGNSQLLIDENNCLLTDTYFSGVVYIDKHEFEVYQNSDFKKAGIFNLKTGIDWSAKTPRQKCNEASALFNLKLKERIENSALNCFCEYPRIIDYIENRGSTDSSYLQMEFQNNFLIISSSTFNQEAEEEKINYHCKYCTSEYTRRYRERGIDQISTLKNKIDNPTGKMPDEFAPNFLTANFDHVFKRESYIHREKMFQSDCELLMHYLFEKK